MPAPSVHNCSSERSGCGGTDIHVRECLLVHFRYARAGAEDGSSIHLGEIPASANCSQRVRCVLRSATVLYWSSWKGERYRMKVEVGNQRKVKGPFPGSTNNKSYGHWTILGPSDARASKGDLSKRSAGYGSAVFSWQDRPMVGSSGSERPCFPHECYIRRRGVRPPG
jgi:hypothetical protein